MKNSSGFTLLEMIIAITILAALMLYSNQSIQNGIKAKVKIQTQIDDMSVVRDALKIIEKDVHLAMHYRDIEMEFKQQVQKSNSNGGIPNPQTNQQAAVGAGNAAATAANAATAAQQRQQMQQNIAQWMANDPRRVDPTTHFVGSADEMHFITMNAPRVAADQPQADFVKVGYFLQTCTHINSTSGSSKCLWRSEDPLVEGDVTKNGPATVLLENVTEFKLRYISSSQQDWVSDWNSRTGDANTKGKYPETVEISLTVTKGEGEKAKKISMQIVAPVRFPNNPTSNNGSPQTPGGVPAPTQGVLPGGGQ